jgi:hypothetical protein
LCSAGNSVSPSHPSFATVVTTVGGMNMIQDSPSTIQLP